MVGKAIDPRRDVRIAAAKLRPRSLPEGHVVRPRLHALLGPATGAQVTLVSAPAGCGKTTLVRSWLEGLPDGSWAWLTVGPLEQDPLAFWSAVIDSVHQVAPGLCAEARNRLLTGVDVDDALLSLLDALEVAPFDAPLVLVVEDLHRATSPEVERSLAWFVENLPESVHLVLTTRVDPQLPIALLRLRGDLAEVRQSDLAVCDREADALMAGLGIELTPCHLHTLNERAEGWIAGLRLAGAAMRGTPDIAGYVDSFGGWERSIAELLLDEVLATLDEEHRSFLVRTSILDELSGPLCDAVTGRPADSGTILRDLAGSQTFVERLEGEGEWYRNHQLFGDLLRRELMATEPDLVPTLHQRAADWYASTDRPVEALEHALAAGDEVRVLDLVAAYSVHLNEQGHDALARSAIKSLSDEFVMADIDRAMGYGEALAWTGYAVQAMELIDRVSRMVGPDDAEVRARMHLTLGIARGFAGDLDGCLRDIAEMQAALGRVPDGEVGRWLPVNTARALRIADRPEQALAQLANATRAVDSSPMLLSQVEGTRAEVELERGDLTAAAARADQAVADWRAAGAAMNTDALCAQARGRFEAGDV
ncbi:MAG TPA: AAA family ATPase, partial [Acidimicrobiales bacterium]